MTETKKPTKTGDSFIGEDSIEIVFGKKEYIVHRLKAGKFYDALKIYTDMLKDIAPKAPVSGKGEAIVDFDKVIVGMFQSWPEKMTQFIAVCCSTIESEEKITAGFIKDEAYPEQITKAFSGLLKLNRVVENLKNFAAPMGELGAKVETKK